MKRILLTLLLTSLLGLFSCSGNQADSPAGAAKVPHKVGVEPITAEFVEQDSYNVAYWLENGFSSRILVRFSGYDGLAPVSGEKLDKIKELAAKHAYRELRSAGDGISEGRLYDAWNVAYLANRLGLVREIYWVVPTFSSVDEDELASFKDYLKGLYPDDSKDIDAITLEGAVAGGKVNGVPVRLLGLQDLKDPGEPVLLDMDASFFQAMYQDEKETGSLSFIAGMFKLLSEAELSADAVSISASVEDNRASLKFRSFARYFERLIKEPGLIASEPPRLWSERAEAWRAEQRDPEIAVPIYKRIIEQFPEDAPSRYDLADLYFRLGELEACAAQLEAAVGLDPGYLPAYTLYRDRLAASGKSDSAAKFYASRPGAKG